ANVDRGNPRAGRLAPGELDSGQLRHSSSIWNHDPGYPPCRRPDPLQSCRPGSHRRRGLPHRNGRAATAGQTGSPGYPGRAGRAMKIVTAADMGEIDRLTKEEYPVASLTLSE